MSTYYSETNDTITAIASPSGKGAISIIRVSGPDSISVLSNIFVSSSKGKTRKINTSGTYIGFIKANNKIIDQVVVSVKKGPHTFTGEDTVEINCHGNPLISNLILDFTISKGARLADPGEFTYRAFINNKIDLIQAESINDIINAVSYSSVELSISNLKGRLSDKIKGISNSLKDLLISIEVTIDHSDDDYIPEDLTKVNHKIKGVIKEIETLIDSYSIARDIKQGINIAIVGRANVGKSSLFNLLIKRDKSIISHIAGTTRDVVEEYLELESNLIKMIDTAGIKKTKDHIEKEALKKTFRSIKSSDILLLLFDASNKLTRQDIELVKELSESNSYIIIILNKCDLKQVIDEKKLKEMFPKRTALKISVSRETGIKKIEDRIIKFIRSYDVKDKVVINNIRQKNILISTIKSLKHVIESMDNNYYFDIIASDLKKAIDELGKITGQYTTENMLNDIFSNFCIGK